MLELLHLIALHANRHTSYSAVGLEPGLRFLLADCAAENTAKLSARSSDAQSSRRKPSRLLCSEQAGCWNSGRAGWVVGWVVRIEARTAQPGGTFFTVFRSLCLKVMSTGPQGPKVLWGPLETLPTHIRPRTSEDRRSFK